MCGVTGFITHDAELLRQGERHASAMAQAIAHRGPDDMGAWCDPAAGIAFGHRRLAIIDLSPAGHQPMALNAGRYVLAFNGEIYNHAELRKELEGLGPVRVWRGHSDTETLLAAFEAWGIEGSLARSVGMFAVAVWDTRDRVLWLARDRFGEKPLYYGWVGQSFVFGSELKALRAFPGFDNGICRDALAQYFRFMYVPAPRSIYEGIYKLEPGCMLRVVGGIAGGPPRTPLRPGGTHGAFTLQRWWSPAQAIAAGSAAPIHDEREAREGLEEHLSTAVRLQSLADVPLGAFLSGGVDSSTIVALMQKQATRPVRTFTIGFEEASFDEAPFARAVARHLGTDHTEVRVTATDSQNVIAQLPSMYDEPFADSSQIPTHLVSRAARQQVTVALSGDAGDELFGGYNRYFWAPSIWDKLSWIPYPLRNLLGLGIAGLPAGAWDSVGAAWNSIHPATGGIQRLGDKAHKLATRLRQVRSIDDLYTSLVSEWPEAGELLQGLPAGWREPDSLLADALPSAGVSEDQLRMMYWDTLTYLPDDILCKVDRAAMAVGLETRVPMLDHRVAEFSWRLPLSMKIRRGEGKWILRQVLYKHVPRSLTERPKAGFGIPVGDWLRGPLRAWAEQLLEPARIQREGYLRPEPVRAIWHEHLSRERDWTHRVWSVLMFQAWLEANS